MCAEEPAALVTLCSGSPIKGSIKAFFCPRPPPCILETKDEYNPPLPPFKLYKGTSHILRILYLFFRSVKDVSLPT